MSIELESLVFKVDTKELETAVTTVDKLKVAVSDLNQPLQKLGDASKDAAKGVEVLNNTQSGPDGTANSMDRITRIIEKQVQSLRILRNQYIEVKDGTIQLGDGFTKMQANALANLKLLNATEEQVRQLAASFKEYNDITGLNTFDKSASGLNKMQKEVRELERVNALLAKGLNLTRDEIIALARDSIKLEQVFKGDQLVSELQKLESQFVQVAQSRNVLIQQTKASEEAAKQEARVRAELERAGMEMNDQAVAAFRKNEEQKQKLLRETNALISASVRQTELLREGFSAQEAKTFSSMESKGVSPDDIRRYIAAERERKSVIEDRVQIERAAQGVNDQAVALFRKNEEEKQRLLEKTNNDLLRQRQILELVKQGYSSSEAGKMFDLRSKGMNQGEIETYIAQLRRITDETNKVRQAEKEREKEILKVVKANEYLLDVERRLDAQLAEGNRGFNERDAAQLVKIEKAIQTSGFAADQAAAKMQNLRNKIQSVADQRAEGQLRNLSRAISVQMGDVAISLASGMNPLLVMIQQGDQIRGALEQAQNALDGVSDSTKVLRDTMINSSKMIVQGIVDTTKAIGTFFYGALITAGEGANMLMARTLGLSGALEQLNNVAKTNALLGTLLKTLSLLSGTVIVGAITVLGMLAVAFFKVSQENDNVARSLARTGGVLAGTVAEANSYAMAMNQVGISTSAAMQVIGEMAKTGGFLAREIDVVTKSAVALNRVGVASIEETVKAFSDLKKDPVDALNKLARETNLVDLEILKMVQTMDLQGDTSGATALAMREFGRVNEEVAKKVESQLSSLGKAMLSLRDIARGVWQGIRDLFYQTPEEVRLTQEIVKVQAQLQKAIQSDPTSERSILYADTLKSLQDQLRVIQEGNEAQRKQREETEAQRRAIEFTGKLREEQLTREEKWALRSAEIIRNGQRAKLDDLEIQKLISREYLKVFGTQNNNGSGKSQREKDLEVFNNLLANSIELSNDYAEKRQSLDRLIGVIPEEKRIAALIELEQSQPRYTRMLKEQEKAEKDLASAKEYITNILVANDGENKEYARTLSRLSEIMAKFPELAVDIERAKVAVEANKPSVVALTKAVADLEKGTRALVLENSTMLQQFEEEKSQAGLSNREKSKRLALLKLELDRTSDLVKLSEEIIKAQNQGVELPFEKILERIRAIEEKYQNGIVIVDEKETIKTIEEIAAVIDRTLGDAIFEAITGDSKNAAKMLRDAIVKEFTKPVRVFIEGVISNITGNVMKGGSSSGNAIVNRFKDLFGISDNAQSTGGSNGLSGLGNSISTAINAVKMFSSSLKLGANVANYGGSVSGVVSGQIAQGQYANAAGTAFGAAGSYIGGYTAGKLLNQVISGGYSVGDSNKIMNVGAVVGSVLGGPIGTAIGTALGGVINRLFGRKFAGSTLSGQFSSEGFTGSTSEFFKGGLFRSDRTITSALDSRVQSDITKAFSDIKDSAIELGKALGVNADVINGFSKSISIDTKDLNADQINQKLKEALEDVAEDISNIILGGNSASLSKVGENATETLKRLSDSLTIVNLSFRNLGFALKDISVSGAAAASSFIDLFGGIQEMTSALNAYYDNFFTEEEKVANATRNLTQGLAELGVAMPTGADAQEARSAYRKLVEDAMSAGNEELAAGLIKLSTAFAELNPIVQESAGSIGNLMRESLQLRAEIMQLQGDTAGANAIFKQLATEGMTEAEIAVWELNQSLRDQITVIEKQKAIAEERSVLDEKLLQVQGDTAALRRKELEALDPTNRSIQELIWSLEDAKVAAEELAAQEKRIREERIGLENRLLTLLGDTTELRNRELMSVDESNRAILRHIFALEDQKAAANAAAQAYERQKSVVDQFLNAWEGLTNKIMDEVNRIRGIVNGNFQESLMSAEFQFQEALRKARSGDRQSADSLPGLSQKLLDIAGTQARSLTDLRRIQLLTANTLERTVNGILSYDWVNRSLLIPSFASGGDYKGGMALVGENGPELIDFKSRGRVYNSEQTSTMMNGSDVCEKIDALNENISLLRAETRATVSHTAKTAKLLDRVIKDGENISVTVSN